MRLTIRFQLLAVLAALVAVAGATSLLVWHARGSATATIDTIFVDRVRPLAELKEIADAYAVDIVDMTHKVSSGLTGWDDGAALLAASRARIAELWRGYLATRLTEEETRLSTEAARLMDESAAHLTRLADIVANRDLAALDRFRAEVLYQSIDPISEAISALIALQVVEVEHEYADASATLGLVSIGAQVLLVLSVLATVFGGFVVLVRVTRPLGGLTAAMKALAAGRHETNVPSLDRKDEVGDMAATVAIFRQGLIDLDRATRERAEAEAADRARHAALMSRLGASVSKVVEAAAEGDFTRRADADFADPELQALAEGLNRLVSGVAGGLDAARSALADLSDGDVTVEMRGRFSGAFADLQASLGESVARLAETVAEIGRASGTIRSNAETIASDARNLAQRTESQAAAIEELSATMEEMSATVRQNAENAGTASRLVAETADEASRGAVVASQAAETMAAMEAATRRITEIVGIIDGFAFQTNLLALNAAVEAARAGDAGKGFAVVAGEVRDLAQRSGDAARQIRAVVAETAASVELGATRVRASGMALTTIHAAITRARDIVDDISQASREQSAGVNEIAQALAQMDSATQANAGLAETSAANAEGLRLEGETLARLLAFFRGQDTRAAQRAAA